MGALFVLDGNDGSGKKVQTRELSERLARQHNVRVFEFPDYTTPSGKLTRELLFDPEIDFVKLAPQLAFLPYALNRAAKRPQIVDALCAGYVVCDRYVETNWAYQAASISTNVTWNSRSASRRCTTPWRASVLTSVGTWLSVFATDACDRPRRSLTKSGRLCCLLFRHDQG